MLTSGMLDKHEVFLTPLRVRLPQQENIELSPEGSVMFASNFP
jgi:hypothetical protein